MSLLFLLRPFNLCFLILSNTILGKLFDLVNNYFLHRRANKVKSKFSQMTDYLVGIFK